jgi:hypothetical protein
MMSLSGRATRRGLRRCGWTFAAAAVAILSLPSVAGAKAFLFSFAHVTNRIDTFWFRWMGCSELFPSAT